MSDKQVFEKPIDVYRHLKANGWKVGKSKVYSDVGTRLKPDKDGKYSLETVELYALKYLKRVAPSGPENVADELEKLHLERLRREVSLRKRQEEKLCFELELKKGKYIPIEQFERELAARMIVLRAGFANMIALCLDDWIAALQDDPVKGRAFMREAIIENYHELLYEYARLPEWTVEFTNDPDRQTKN